jgi:uncharacterized protein (DUF433 family)
VVAEIRSSSALDRFGVPLYTVAEAARYLAVPPSTFRSWTHGSRPHGDGPDDVVGAPVLTAMPPAGRHHPVIPFIGLAEGLVLTAFRQSGVPLQRIRPAVTRLAQEFGLEHVLASQQLFTDGAEVLFDYREGDRDSSGGRPVRELVVVRNGQRVFNDVVDSYLQRVEFDDDGYVRLIRLPAYQVAEVVVDPLRGFGQPVFSRGGARLADALALFDAGDSLDVVAAEFGMPLDQLEDAVRVAARTAA